MRVQFELHCKFKPFFVCVCLIRCWSLFFVSPLFQVERNGGLLEALRILQGSQADSQNRPIEKEIEDRWFSEE